MGKFKRPNKSKGMKGKREEETPRWKGGEVMRQGYKFVYKPGHPNSTYSNKTYIAEHRLIMSEHLGRALDPGEIVHHINENILDNRIENLKLTTRSEHNKDHKFLVGHV